MTADLTYSCNQGITRFFPETPAGEEAYSVMAAADPDGVVAFFPQQVPGVMRQLWAAGLTVRKAKATKPLSLDEIDAMLAELGAL